MQLAPVSSPGDGLVANARCLPMLPDACQMHRTYIRMPIICLADASQMVGNANICLYYFTYSYVDSLESRAGS